MKFSPPDPRPPYALSEQEPTAYLLFGLLFACVLVGVDLDDGGECDRAESLMTTDRLTGEKGGAQMHFRGRGGGGGGRAHFLEPAPNLQGSSHDQGPTRPQRAEGSQRSDNMLTTPSRLINSKKAWGLKGLRGFFVAQGCRQARWGKMEWRRGPM